MSEVVISQPTIVPPGVTSTQGKWSVERHASVCGRNSWLCGILLSPICMCPLGLLLPLDKMSVYTDEHGKTYNTKGICIRESKSKTTAFSNENCLDMVLCCQLLC